MPRDTLTFRIASADKEALDSIASALDRDRTYVLNEAVRAYIDTHSWQARHIEEGLRQADSGEFATDREVRRALRRRSQ